MLTIGRFADATGLTVRALRYYEEIGLLAPVHVDPETGYRYYDSSQVETAVAIRRLRALEMPLDEISGLLTADGEGVRDRLAAHAYRAGAEAHDKHMLRLELAALIDGGGETIPISIVDEPELRLAAEMRQLHDGEVAYGIPAMARTVRTWLEQQGRQPAGPMTAVFRGGDRERWHLVEVGWPVEAGVEGDERVAVRTYPAGRAATYDYNGDFAQLPAAAQRFIHTVLGQGLRVVQPIRIAYPTKTHARIVWSLTSAP